ncbi:MULTISPECIES: hypothetical protein [Clostridium]|uniref:hypothetical protein n=1 Tax=Clostridium TaxID=1485 RepID=UPI00082568CA|nr:MULTISPECIES: hypothetical protein [Clostridium]PJI07793.1 hypothetical protein CUB90_07905 [Clostridium sp. CT7]
MRVNNRRKTTISIKMFMSELGEHFSEKVKKRLTDLDLRCVLSRKDHEYNVLDLKHVEHIKYNENKLMKSLKEYVYAEFAVVDGVLYFGQNCLENDQVMQSGVVEKIYNYLDGDGMIFLENKNFKKIDDNNIDYVVDNILLKCPQVSQKYIDVVNEMLSLADRK